jgi:RHS repeat-associated protein
MKSVQIQAFSEPPLAATPQLSEKPRQGFETKKTARKPGSSSCNFKVTLGLRATVVENGVRETYSARYYNQNTGRFLSRDPQEYTPLKWSGSPLKSTGKPPIDPKKLHKYLYAIGDPVNRIDPRGREDEAEEAGALEESEALAEEETYKLKTLMEYRLQLLEQGGYEISKEGTESYADELLEDFIKMWNNK